MTAPRFRRARLPRVRMARCRICRGPALECEIDAGRCGRCAYRDHNAQRWYDNAQSFRRAARAWQSWAEDLTGDRSSGDELQRRAIAAELARAQVRAARWKALARHLRIQRGLHAGYGDDADRELAQLRTMLDTAAERDRALCAELDDLRTELAGLGARLTAAAGEFGWQARVDRASADDPRLPAEVRRYSRGRAVGLEVARNWLAPLLGRAPATSATTENKSSALSSFPGATGAPAMQRGKVMNNKQVAADAVTSTEGRTFTTSAKSKAETPSEPRLEKPRCQDGAIGPTGRSSEERHEAGGADHCAGVQDPAREDWERGPEAARGRTRRAARGAELHTAKALQCFAPLGAIDLGADRRAAPHILAAHHALTAARDALELACGILDHDETRDTLDRAVLTIVTPSGARYRAKVESRRGPLVLLVAELIGEPATLTGRSFSPTLAPTWWHLDRGAPLQNYVGRWQLIVDGEV